MAIPEDVFIGGAKGQARRLFFNNPAGSFERKILPEGVEAEDVDALIFDANRTAPMTFTSSAGAANFRLVIKVIRTVQVSMTAKGGLRLAPEALFGHARQRLLCRSNIDDGDGDLDLFVGEEWNPGTSTAPLFVSAAQ